MDTVDKDKRSKIMSLVHSQNTRPELMIRKNLHAKGIRYKLYSKDLPGKPDLCLPKYKAVIFIHGCQWHWHGCTRSRMPSTNIDYWEGKITKNRLRDQNNINELIKNGWRVLIIWECAIKKKIIDKTINITIQWLSDNNLSLNQIELNNKKIPILSSTPLSNNDF